MSPEAEDRNIDLLQSVLREVPHPEKVANLLISYFKSQLTSFPEEEVEKGVVNSILELNHEFATSKTTHGHKVREFLDIPFSEQAEGVGSIHAYVQPSLRQIAHEVKEGNHGLIPGLLEQITLADEKIFSDKEKLFSLPRESSEEEKIARENLKELEKHFNEKLGISFLFFQPELAWFNRFHQAKVIAHDQEEIDLSLHLAQEFLVFRLEVLKDVSLTDNQIIGLSDISLADAHTVIIHMRNLFAEQARYKRYQDLFDDRFRSITKIVTALFDDPNVARTYEISEEEIYAIVSREIPSDAIKFSLPAPANKTQEIDWDETIARISNDLGGQIIYGLTIRRARDLVRFAKTGEMEPRELENMFEEFLKQFIEEEANQLRMLSEDQQYQAIYQLLTQKDEEEILEEAGPIQNPALATRYTNEKLVLEIAKYLVVKMIKDNTEKMSEENLDPDLISDWQWYAYAHDLVRSHLMDAFDITKALQERLAN